MLFHHHGYVSENPRTKPTEEGHSYADQLPDNIDVLIVGSGPAGMILAAQLSMFPSITTRMVERRPGREDRRAVEVHLTAEGERLVASIALHHRTEVKLLGDVFRDLAAQLH